MEERKITMKNIFTLLLAFVLLFCCANAETVFVTISNGQGELVVAAEAFDVNDADGDGALSIYDALFAAHDERFEGGAQAGFMAANTDHDNSIQRLWGEENGGSYGYFVNNISAYSLSDPIQEGDSLHAFAYTDLECWSDTYSYFNFEITDISAGESISLQLNMQSYDADWMPVVDPVAGAMILIDGISSEIITDETGAAAIVFNQPGTYVLSAVSEEVNLVPPVCIVNVK